MTNQDHEEIIRKLFKGIVVAIDDEITLEGETKAKEITEETNTEKGDINRIIEKITDESIPVIKFKDLPNGEKTKHLQNISFLILDWELNEGGSDANDKRNIDFIENFSKICFCPIFIFTNEDVDVIKETLIDVELIKNPAHSRIFIKDKKEIEDGELFKEISDWLDKTPSMYVLKEWEKEYNDSKNRLFSDFDNLDPMWPRIMWDAFEKDRVNKSLEIGDIMSRNLQSRMEPFGFNKDILQSTASNNFDKENLKKVLEGVKFLKKEKLYGGNGDVENIGTGDVFYDGIQEKYFLNIKAQCDLVRRKNPELYLLEGKAGEPDDYGDIAIKCFAKAEFNGSHYKDEISFTTVPFIDDGKIVIFNFKKLIIKKWNGCIDNACVTGAKCAGKGECLQVLKNMRIGRLLPPYITQIQKKFAFYIQREGIPSIPAKAVAVKNKDGTDLL